MYKINSEIKEPTILKVQSISDDRGYLVPITDDIDHKLFHRCYIVGDYGKGVIRGLHYHKLEAKIFAIVSGAAKFITLKLPEDIADRNNENEIKNFIHDHPQNVQSFVMSNRHHAVLYIPPFYANGG
jgi:dTDP-4-dehydrorhamnose 3,5-epimerase-like enzyme